VRLHALKRSLQEQVITPVAFATAEDELLDEWQLRYDATQKGNWSKKMIPSVRWRYHLPMRLDHFTTQFLTGHGDFRAKLHSFTLAPDPICVCDRRPETANHVLRFCPRTKRARTTLKKALSDESVSWPPADGAFLKSKAIYEAMVRFAKEALTNCTDR